MLDQIEALLTSYAHYKDDNSKRFDFQDYLMSNDDEEKTLFFEPIMAYNSEISFEFSNMHALHSIFILDKLYI